VKERPLDGTHATHDADPPGLPDEKSGYFFFGPYNRGPIRRVNLYGADAAQERLMPCLADAGHLLAGLPRDELPVPIPPPTLATKETSKRWLYVLFDLAWAEIPGSLLRPSKPRCAWYLNVWIPVRTIETHRIYGDRLPFAEILRKIPYPPTWCSTIDDVAQASIYAIDILLTVPAPSELSRWNAVFDEARLGVLDALERSEVHSIDYESRGFSSFPENSPENSTGASLVHGLERSEVHSIDYESLETGATDSKPPAAKTKQGEGDGGAGLTAGRPVKKRKRRNADPGKTAKRAARQEREKADKRLWEAWANGSGQYPIIADLAKEKGIPELDVKRALDRHRKRLERAGKWPPDKADK
jgi:hypothetical protein